MFSTLTGGFTLLMAIAVGLAAAEQATVEPFRAARRQAEPGTHTVQSKDVYKNLFTGSEVRTPIAPPKFVVAPEFKMSSGSVRIVSTVQLSGTEQLDRVKCHLRMVEVDPTYDAKIRIQIPADQIANSRIRRIGPPPCHR